LEPCFAGVYSLDNYKIDPINTLGTKWAIYSPDEAPSKTSPGDGRAFISFEGKLGAKCDHCNDTVHFLIFHSENKNQVGKLVDKKRTFCCTPQLKGDGECQQVGGLIGFENPNAQTWTSSVHINETKTPFNFDYHVTKSGVYYLLGLNCQSNDTDTPTVLVDGKLIFMNPYGYLSADSYPLMPFYAIESAIYVCLGIFWLILSLKYRRELLTLQNCIGGVIVLGVIEGATLYFNDLGYNISGQNYTAAMMTGVIVSTIKKAVSRLLILVVSLGYGVMKPTLGNAKGKIFLLGVLYLIFSGVLNIVELVQRTTIASLSIVFFLVLPVAVMDTIFYWWIFLSLLTSISQLQVRKQVIKFHMYKQLFKTLIASGAISAVLILLQFFISLSVEGDSQWRYQFVWSAFWHLLYLAILMSIVILWRPTDNNTRYAYAELGPDPQEITLHTFNNGDVVQRKQADSTLEPVTKITMNESTASFTITDDEDQSGKME
jgi:hypothetical protein